MKQLVKVVEILPQRLMRKTEIFPWWEHPPCQAALRAWTCSRAFDHEYALK